MTDSPPLRSHTFIAGLDIASLTFVVRLLDHAGTPLGNTTEFGNSSAGFKEFQRWLKGQGATASQTLIVMEATGVYWEVCALALHAAGFAVNVVNPAQIKAFARTTLRRVKTDATDADLIARFALSVPLPAWQPPSLELEGLQLMMRQREDFLAMLQQQENQLHSLERRPHVPQSVLEAAKEHVNFLKKLIENIEDNFKKEIKQYPQWQQSLELLLTIPGVGLITAAILLTETGALGNFIEARQLTAYAGIAPAPFSSGSSVKRPSSISKIGDPRLRRALYMAALSASRLESSPYREFYKRLCAKGKPKKLAFVAVARKLMVLCFRIIRSQKAYDPNYGKNTEHKLALA